MPDLATLKDAPVEVRSMLRFAAIAAAYGVLACLWAFLIKPLNAPDEPDHLLIATFIADHGRRPIAGVDVHPYFSHRRTHAQEPLTSAKVIARPDDYVIQNTYASLPAAPYYVAAAGIRLSRLLGATDLTGARLASAVCGVLTIFFLGLMGTFWAPGTRHMQVLLPASFAFLPQFVFVGAYTNSDAFATMAATAAFACLLECHRTRWAYAWSVAFGVASACVLLSRPNAYAVLPPLAVGGLVLGRAHLRRVAISVVVACALVAPTALQNWKHYGDPTGVSAFSEMKDRALEGVPAELRSKLDYTNEHQSGRFANMTVKKMLHRGWVKYVAQSFVGTFGWMEYRLPRPLLVTYYILGGLAVLGGLIGLGRGRKSGFSALWPFVVMGVASVLIAILLAAYNTVAVTWQPQGRYLFPAAPGFAIIFGAGLVSLAPAHATRICGGVVGLLVVLMLATTVWFPG